MLGGDEEQVEEKDNPLAEEGLPIIVKRTAVPKLQG